MTTRVHLLDLPVPPAGGGGSIHPALIVGEHVRILFDAGYPGQLEVLAAALARAGCALDRLTHVALSHHDHDHVGCLTALKRAHPGIVVVAGEREAPFIAGQAEPPRLAQAKAINAGLEGDALAWGQAFVAYLHTIEPCPVDLTIGSAGAAWDGGLRWVPTPGHSPGHLSLLVRDTGDLLAGDALAAEGGRLVIANPQYTLDPHACRQSVRDMAALAPTRICCYHGGIVDNAGNRALLELERRLDLPS